MCPQRVCVCQCVCACMQSRACVPQQRDACAHPQVPACLACSTPPWPLESPERVELGGEGVERRGREGSTRRGQRRPRPPSPPSTHSAGVRARQRRCSRAPPGAEAPRVGLGGSPQACMGVDRGRLATSSLLSPRRLHERHQKSKLSSHARARVVGGGGQSPLDFVVKRWGYPSLLLRCLWACGYRPSSFVHRGSREGRAGGGVGGPGRAQGPRMRSLATLEACCSASFALALRPHLRGFARKPACRQIFESLKGRKRQSLGRIN